MHDPNFLVIGFQKCGTTWLSKMMRQHPQIFTPEKKELHFFNLKKNYEQGIDSYRACFSERTDEIAVGEFTPNYAWNCTNEKEIAELGVRQNIAETIHGYYPSIKLIVVLRNPVDRAVSAYHHFMRSRKYAPGSNLMDVGQSNGIISMGNYYDHLRQWLDYFPREQFLFLIYEDDIKRNQERTFRNIFEFLGVDKDFLPENTANRYNTKAGSLFLYTNYYFPSLAKKIFGTFPSLKSVQFPKIEIEPKDLRELSELYAKTNDGLGGLIGRTLPW